VIIIYYNNTIKEESFINRSLNQPILEKMMFNHMSYKVMLWGTGEKQSFYFSTLKDAAEKFISLAEEYQAKP